MKTKLSELTVMKSAAGYYIGRYDEMGPYDRWSGYYPTKEAAQYVLENEKGYLYQRLWKYDL